MTTPLTTEMPQWLEPVAHDPSIDDLLFIWLAGAERPEHQVHEQAGSHVS
jgi:hypothetical protein